MAPDPKWFNTINLRCSLVLNVTFPSFIRGQNAEQLEAVIFPETPTGASAPP
jgi:hypothetical protein